MILRVYMCVAEPNPAAKSEGTLSEGRPMRSTTSYVLKGERST